MYTLTELASQFETKTQLLCAARESLFNAAESVVSATEALTNAKASAFNAGLINGSNDDKRKTQYAEICQSEYAALREAEANERAARYHLEQAQSNLDLTRYLLRVLELSAHL